MKDKYGTLMVMSVLSLCFGAFGTYDVIDPAPGNGRAVAIRVGILAIATIAGFSVVWMLEARKKSRHSRLAPRESNGEAAALLKSRLCRQSAQKLWREYQEMLAPKPLFIRVERPQASLSADSQLRETTEHAI